MNKDKKTCLLTNKTKNKNMTIIHNIEILIGISRIENWYSAFGKKFTKVLTINCLVYM